jgi:hypothetical protein
LRNSSGSLAILLAILRAAFRAINAKKEAREPSSKEPQRNYACQAEEDRQHRA